MLIKIVLTGGPFDGQVLQSDGMPPQFIVPALHPDKPIYGCTLCQCCATDATELAPPLQEPLSCGRRSRCLAPDFVFEQAQEFPEPRAVVLSYQKPR